MSKIGIIGGSGVYKIKDVEIINEHIIETPYGSPSDKILEMKLGEVEFYFLARHGMRHDILPHEINYRANIFALKSLGVEYLISVSAVGSLKEELPPKTFVLVDQFIDWTKGIRERSFFGKGIVGHVSVAEPINNQLRELINTNITNKNLTIVNGGIYICIEGPQFSTKAESNLYRSFGASVIGMTNVPESYLAKEADIAFSTIAMVTDYDCWRDEHCNVEDIMKVMNDNNENLQILLKEVLPALSNNQFSFKKEVRNSIMTNSKNLKEEQKNIVDILSK